eukprot:scaffold119983_cov42-Tisochrysis_lutea.AAC.4
MVVGVPPFWGDTIKDVYKKVINTQPKFAGVQGGRGGSPPRAVLIITGSKSVVLGITRGMPTVKRHANTSLYVFPFILHIPLSS